MAKKENMSVNSVLSELENGKNKFSKSFFTKYVVEYKIEDNNIKILSNIGDYRIVKNTKSNLTKINQTIVKNKIAIAKRIDEYENNFRERLISLLFNIILVSGCGVLIPLSFFTGIYAFFILSVIVFSISVIVSVSRLFDYYLLIKEIQNLKSITGYKKSSEFKLSSINVKSIKSR